MMSMHLKMLLLGKTGHGKSATGNFILGRRVFETSSNTTSHTREVDVGFAEFDVHKLMVVDGPGLDDTDKNKVLDKEAAAKHMSTALAKCYGTIDVFLFVLKFGNRFTSEEKSALEALKKIFGNKYMDHVIVVVTHGDVFENAMEDDETGLSFHEWCVRQTGEFRQLYEECRGKCVLFNNREKIKEKIQTQKQELVHLVLSLRDQLGHYTSQCFTDAESERKKLIVELKAPQLTLEIQEKLSFLTGDLRQLITQPSDIARDKINARIGELKKEIEDTDQGFGVLLNLKKLVEQIEGNFNDTCKLKSLISELEDIRKARIIWTVLGSVVAIVGGTLCLVAAPVAVIAISAGAAALALGGGATAVGGAVTTGVSRHFLGSKEKENQEKQNKLKDKIQKTL